MSALRVERFLPGSWNYHDDPPQLFVYFTHSNIAKREIMWRLFALLIYGIHSCKLKLKRLDIDVKRHFCPTINLSYLGWLLTVTGYFQFLNLISIFFSDIPHTARPSIVIWWQIMARQLKFLFRRDYILRNGSQIKNVLNAKLLGHFC